MDRTYIINGRFLSQKMTGVHRYAYEMCCALHRADFKFVVVAPKKILLNYICPFQIIQVGRTTSHIWEQFELPFYVRKHYKKSILINFTGTGSLFHKNIVSTIHDLSFLENPKWFSKSYYLFYRYLTPMVVKKAKKIITVSNFSKKEIITRLEVQKDKVVVVYNAVSDKIKLKNEVKKEKIILSVSSIDPRKNFLRLIEAFEQLQSWGYKLVIVGEYNDVFGKNNLFQDNDNVKFTGYISDDELVTLYKKASVFVYPSLYEGFGIPNLEAMSNGCPVVTSNIPPHREVCEKAALYFNPYSSEDLGKKIKKLIENENFMAEMIQRGYERTQSFSWDKSAEKLIKTLNEIALK